MKKNYFFGLALLSQFAFAQLNFTSIPVKATDMIYDANTDRIYVAISSLNGANGNSIGVLNPRTKVLESTTFVGSEPITMAISDDSKYIFVGFSGTNTIRRYNIATKTAEAPFSLGSSNSGPLYAGDIKVMPGSNSTIAVSKKQNGTSAPFKGVAIYDNGVQRPITTMDPNNFTYDSADKIAFINPSLIYGLSMSFSSSQPFRQISVTATGAVDTNNNVYGLSNTATDITYFENKMYATNGQVVANLGPQAYLEGTYAGSNGVFSIDPVKRIISFVNYYPSSYRRFNLDNYTLIDETLVSNDSKLTAVSCGGGCYAFNTANEIFLAIDSNLAVSGTGISNNLAIYPNPTSTELNIAIASPIKISGTEIFDVSGKLVYQSRNDDRKINISSLSTGNYLLLVKDQNGKVYQTKFIKN